MGRLLLAGIDPDRMTGAKLYRAVWALLVEWSTTTSGEVADGVREMWEKLRGADPAAAAAMPEPAQAPGAAQPVAPRPAPTGAAPAPGALTERPNAEQRLAWALAASERGANVIGDMNPDAAGAGAAEKVGG